MFARTARAGLLGLALLASSPLAQLPDAKATPLRLSHRTPRGSPGAFAADDLHLLGWFSNESFAPAGVTAGRSSDCWGYTSPSGREYALMCGSHGLAVIEVTDPGDARLITHVDGPVNGWRDVKTYDEYAYVVTEGFGAGVQVIDLTAIDQGVAALVFTVNPGGTGTSTHNVAIDEDSGFLYRCGGGGALRTLRVYDLANPAMPVRVGDWNQRYVHDAQVVTFTSGPAAGRQLCFACTGGTGQLEVLDVTDKANIVSVFRTDYDPTNARYSHQVWYDPTSQNLYLNDESDEGPTVPFSTIYVMDASNPLAPVPAGSFHNGNPTTGHNLYVADSLLYAANYASGLRVFDLGVDPLSPPEVAWFDTYPEGDSLGFIGLWSCFPFFDSGTILGSDRERGLFVWRRGSAPLTFDAPGGLPDSVPPPGGPLRVRISEDSAGVLDRESVELFVDRGQGFERSPMHDVGADRFEGLLKTGTACAQGLRWYAQARTTDGVTYRFPHLAPLETHHVVAATRRRVLHDDPAEVDLGWTAGQAGDTASTGVWELGDPEGTAAQPEDDHSPDGTSCWFTGQGSVSVGSNDVDDGFTTLVSPLLDASGAPDPWVTLWAWWHTTDPAQPADDTLRIELSADGGATWVVVEVLDETTHGWIPVRVRLGDHVTPSDQVRLRFTASDLGTASIAEGAIDDLRLVRYRCSPGRAPAGRPRPR